MWAAIKLFFSSNAVAAMQKAALLMGAIGAVLAIYRAGAKSEENDNIKEELGYAKKALKQDAVVAGNDDVDGMRDRLSEALRHKHDS